jgi:hypothetical protein
MLYTSAKIDVWQVCDRHGQWHPSVLVKDAMRLTLSRLPELRSDKTVRIRRAFSQKKLEESMHEFMQSVLVEVSSSFGLRIPSSRWRLRRRLRLGFF